MDNTEVKSNNKPLKFFQPFNILVALSFFSPLIVACCITSLSFIFQNFKGLIYLGFLIGVALLRELIYYANKVKPMEDDNNICNSIQYSKYGNGSFSSFVFAFTISYLSVPMITYKNSNFWYITSLISYFFIDIFIKLYEKCIVNMSSLLLNVLGGGVLGYLVVTLITWGGSSKYLFYNEQTSNAEICTQPSTQTFKCKVYKDGELVGSI